MWSGGLTLRKRHPTNTTKHCIIRLLFTSVFLHFIPENRSTYGLHSSIVLLAKVPQNMEYRRNTYDQHEKMHFRRTDRSRPHYRSHHPCNGGGGADYDLLGSCCQGRKEHRNHRFKQHQGVWEHDADGQLRCIRRAGNPHQRRQHRPDGQSGDTAGDDPPHQPDQKGQWSVRVAGQ